MKLEPKTPPREFTVGRDAQITIKDCGDVYLAPDEQVTFKTPDGGEFDVARKNWGFYGSPSLNGRLPDHRLNPVLAYNQNGKYYLLLVEQGYEKEFEAYCHDEKCYIVGWLHRDETLNHIRNCLTIPAPPFSLQPYHLLVKQYTRPPTGETAFNLGNKAYDRKIYECPLTGHFLNDFQFNLDDLYEKAYVDAAYDSTLSDKFEEIMSLPEGHSDNKARVQRILAYCSDKIGSVLDIGSGLCVFGHEMKSAGWAVSCIDLDQRQIDHARDKVGVSAFKGRLGNLTPDLVGQHDLITFNKVLEHLKDPVAELSRSRRFLKEEGLIYIELPDGETAQKDKTGFDREEFFIDHYHVFSSTSFTLLCHMADMELLSMSRLIEPSGKYTLYGFVKPRKSI